MVKEFRNRDPEYLDWIAAHPDWFVMNKTLAGHQPGSLWLHHAYCTAIIGAPANGASWTTTSTKYGARTLAELKRFAASEWQGMPEKCTKCL